MARYIVTVDEGRSSQGTKDDIESALIEFGFDDVTVEVDEE